MYKVRTNTTTIEKSILKLIESVQKSRNKNSLDDFLTLMARLNNPHINLPKTIHVAGTNGKGSTIAFLKGILEAVGYSVHRYTSPHLISICERIQLNGKNIQAEDLMNTLKNVIRSSHNLSLSFFDFLTAVAFVEFSKTPADFLLLEAGLGGFFDNTNVITRPVATIITQIGMDHMDVLGDTLPQIAAQKAGIIKMGCPVITLNHKEDILQVIKTQAIKQNAPLYIETPQQPLELGLLGNHQSQNASLAIRAAKLIANPTAKQIGIGLKNAHWPGRIQSVTLHNKKAWLDIAHNPSGIRAVIDTMKAITSPPLHVIFSLRKTKNLKGFLKELKGHIRSLTYIPVEGSLASHSQEAIELASKEIDLQCNLAPNLKSALEAITEGEILITGSVFLVGRALELSTSTNVYV